MFRDAWLIDPWAFARTSGRRNGAMGLAELSRLCGSVALPGGVFDVSAAGYVAEGGRAYINVRASGAMWLTCQRCLEPVEHLVRHDALFQLWRPGEALPDDELLEDGFDALPAGNEMDLAQLIEDEILLGLPLSPRHVDCQVPHAVFVAADVSSFDVLKKLKRPH